MGLTVPQEIVDARSTYSLSVMIQLTEILLSEMDTNFYVAQSHPARLKKLLGWLYALREKSFGVEKGSALSDTGLLGTLDLSDYKDLLGN